MADFIHLHNHTHYSLQDGACTVEGLLKAAKKNGMQSVALTDHGVLYGVGEFYKKAKKEGIKPIVGMEAYVVAEGSRFNKSRGEDEFGKKKTKHYHHLILLAKDRQGFKNLSKLSTFGHTEGFYYRPRIDLELIRKYREGLVCTSACAGGVVSAHLIENNFEKARQAAITYKEIFGDDFYLEIQDHGLEVEKAILEGVPKLSKELGIKMVATNDCHYIEKEHAIAHNILLLLADKEGRDYHDLRYGTDQIYFKSEEEMKKLFKGYKGAIENTLEIDSKINLDLSTKGNHFPVFPIPEESGAKNLDEYFELLAREGLSQKLPNADKELVERFDFEIDVIKKMGFSGYFLVVQDFINASKRMGIPVGPGRGSAAGSLVAYCLGITNINPLPYNLLFERFLNPARKSMPDIDVDFADDRRGDVIEYVRQKYGANSVTQIITFNRLSSKAVIRDVARVLKIPIPTVNSITKFIPSKFGKVFTIEQALNEVPELKWVKESVDPDIVNLIKYAKVLEGMNRNSSKHAAGVVIAPGEVSDYVPLATASQSDVVTQFNMKDLEDQGLLKMDFLGLRTLTIIRDAVTLIKKSHGIEIDMDKIPIDDKKAFELFWKGQTTGVFQFESGPMREYLKKLRPTTLSDLSAMNALYRPGPMDFINDFIDRKFGRQEVKYIHQILEPLLKETYGIIVYQEQVIQIANKVGGMTLAEADILRRAMGKKDLAAMKEQKEKFVKGAVETNGIPEKSAIEIFEAIDKFANYGFNKSHSVAYSFVAYQTAYLKAHYAPEFLAANLTNEFGDSNKVAKFLDDCRKLKIEVLPPDINKPSVYFDVEDGKIRFGMCAIKNVGVGSVEEITKCREKLGRDFKSIFDFCANVDTRIANKRTLEGLVLAGAFDRINPNRAQMFAVIEEALQFGQKSQNSSLNNEDNLFASFAEEVSISEPQLPNIPKWSDNEKLSKEREVIGFYVTDHPMRKFELEYKSITTVHLGEVDDMQDLNLVRACGVINELKFKIDKKGGTMAFFKLDDLSGACEAIMFAKSYEKYRALIKEEEPVFILGRPESSGDTIKLHIEEVMSINSARERFTTSLSIYCEKEKFTEEKVFELKEILNGFKGNYPVYLHIYNNGDKRRDFSLSRFSVSLEDELFASIYRSLGDDSVVLNSK
jgi:DNA polymerase-3 subunit alpha